MKWPQLLACLAFTLASACVPGRPVSLAATPSPSIATGTPAATSTIVQQVIAAPTRPTETPTATMTPHPEAEMRVLQLIAQQSCGLGYPPPRLEKQGALYILGCTLAAGHFTSITIQRFDNSTQALALFGDSLKGHPIQDWNGYPISAWQEPFQPSWGTNRILIWQAERWLIQITSFDDTHYQIALDPAQAAESLRQLAIQQGLLSQ